MLVRIILATLVVVAMVSCKAVDRKGGLKEKKAPNEAMVNELVEMALPKGKKHHFNDMRYESEEREGNSKRAAVKVNRWLQTMNGNLVIPYVIDQDVSAAGHVAIQDALHHINTVLSCHSPFVKRDASVHGSLHYLKFVKKSGCWSFVGRVYANQGFQEISIGNGCAYKGTVAHEVLHALGFGHEQSRHDRDSYVTVHWENIQDGYENNFAKKDVADVSEVSKVSPYDFGSVMHYGRDYFTKNGLDTLSPKDNSKTLGQRDALSKLDQEELNKYFQCDDSTYVTDPPTTTTTTTTTTLAPVSRSLIQGTTFDKKYQENGIFYSSWAQTACSNVYSNCADFLRHCGSSSSSLDWVKKDCPLTCGTCPSTESFVELPTGVAPGNYIFAKPYITAQASLTRMQSHCQICTTDNCPRIPICVKTTIERLVDTSNSVGSTRSKMAIGAYNDDGVYITLKKDPIRLSDYSGKVTFSVELNMQCQGMDVFLNGTKGTDKIRVHDLNVFYGTCTNAPSSKRSTSDEEAVEMPIQINSNEEKLSVRGGRSKNLMKITGEEDLISEMKLNMKKKKTLLKKKFNKSKM